eukprot:GHVL01004697.1.p1 GENE.GHVL01004697.1~~GHVL01004697.1.p1  ORF type:complete len:744 (+),score=136.82 GHVL01004697.1:30-2261(+)
MSKDETEQSKLREFVAPLELPSSDACSFEDEAKVTKIQIAALKEKFDEFAVNDFLELDGWKSLASKYRCLAETAMDRFFYAMDTSGRGCLSWEEFQVAAIAADPSTVHILNSFTGYTRTCFIFRYYDVNHSGVLEFDEFKAIITDTSTAMGDIDWKTAAVNKAKEVGFIQQGQDNIQFSCVRQRRFWDVVQNEQLRGTSRLFRFTKSLLKSRRFQSNDSLNSSAYSGIQRCVRENTKLINSGDGELSWVADSIQLGSTDDTYDLSVMKPTNVSFADGNTCAFAQVEGFNNNSKIKYSNDPIVHQIAKRILLDIMECKNKEICTICELLNLILAATELISIEPTIVSCNDIPIKIFGSIYGGLDELIHIFQVHGSVEEIHRMHYLFMGDYIARGKLEVLSVICSLKILYPHRVTLLRGTSDRNEALYGFFQNIPPPPHDNCPFYKGQINDPLKYEIVIYNCILSFFNNLSLAAIVRPSCFICSAGVTIDLSKIMCEVISIKKPVDFNLNTWIANSWFMPPANTKIRNCVIKTLDYEDWNKSLEPKISNFCHETGIGLVIASTLIPPQGFAIGCKGRMIMLNSSSSFCGVVGNCSAIAKLTLAPSGDDYVLSLHTTANKRGDASKSWPIQYIPIPPYTILSSSQISSQGGGEIPNSIATRWGSIELVHSIPTFKRWILMCYLAVFNEDPVDIDILNGNLSIEFEKRLHDDAKLMMKPMNDTSIRRPPMLNPQHPNSYVPPSVANR